MLVSRGVRQVRKEGELRDLFTKLKHYLPQSISVHGTIDMQLLYGPSSMPHTTILAADPPDSCSMVVVTPAFSYKGIQSVTVFWSVEEECSEHMAKLLGMIPGLDWSRPVFLYACGIDVLTEMDSMVIAGVKQVRRLTISSGNIYTLDKPQLDTPKLNGDFYISSLGPADLDRVRSFWKYSFSEQRDAHLKMITAFPSVAIRMKSSNSPLKAKKTDVQNEWDNGTINDKHKDTPEEETNDEETLVSWIHSYKNGLIGNTFTVKEQRRRGLAKVATLTLAHHFLQKGHIPVVAIDSANTSSIAFHKSLGFKQSSTVEYVIRFPEGTSPKDLEFEMSQRDFL
ncbi:hypothetical protein Pmani_015301 [Petrolisthes manimaculis]|uniref:GCN5-related N-acetyltransferase Rv2170-like domain-containing protein n=1 Tax=Petrolisthes manimaculis TaxID=1843537 RepID=A0AAE1PU63_9EUCA|nr:hypothetical protein Pmani_015301 [Petrolisthes manimaculis]